MRWRVQFGINSTSDVWKLCQNWLRRRGENDLAKFPNITSIINPKLYEQHRMIIRLSLAWQYFSVMLSHQSPVLPHFQPVFRAFVCIFVVCFCFNASSSTEFVCKYFSAIFFVLGKSLIVQPYNNCTPLNQSASSNFVMLIIRIFIYWCMQWRNVHWDACGSTSATSRRQAFEVCRPDGLLLN